MMISAHNVSLAFEEGKPVLDGFNLEVGKGELVALLGPSGCGKSTALRLVAGLMAPDEGAVTREKEAELGFVFQDAALMPWATVWDNVLLPLRLKKSAPSTSAKEAAAQALADVGLMGYEKRYPAALSGGQKMRVSVARALAAKPKILLMDEPFAALDEFLRFQMNDLLLELAAERGLTVLFVTHSLYEAAYLADRVCVMKEGRIGGTVAPRLDRHQTPEAQRTSSAFMAAVTETSHYLKEATQ